MLNQVILNGNAKNHIVPLFAGVEQCKSGHKFGPYVRKYYIIHFCLSGKGFLKDKFGLKEINRGEFFIIRPNETTTYYADDKTPWEYSWIAFNGEGAKVFDKNYSVFKGGYQTGLTIKELTENKTGSTAAFLSLIYSLIYKYFEEKNINVSLAQQIKDYVNFNYVKGVSVKSLSEFFGYERSYIYRIFKQKFGVGIKEYILSTCMENAHSLLKNGVNVKQTALSVGYKDQLAFSKAYKNYFGFSPKNTNWENLYTKN